MSVAIQEHEVVSAIRLEGAVDIGSAAGLKEKLLRALSRKAGVRIEIASGAELDITAMQLLCAATRAARNAGVECTIASEAPEWLSGQLAEMGLNGLPDSE
jgi:anti-anti-sigma regulatory factor